MLKEIRADLADLVTNGLGENVTVYDTVPEKINAPCAIIRPADEYVAAPETFGGVGVVQLEVILVAKAGRNNLVSNELDDLVDAVLAEFVGSEIWDSPTVEAPFNAVLAGSNYLVAVLTTTCIHH